MKKKLRTDKRIKGRRTDEERMKECGKEDSLKGWMRIERMV